MSIADNIVAGSLLALAVWGAVGAYRAVFPAPMPPVVIQPPPVAPVAAPMHAPPPLQPVVIIIREAAPAVVEVPQQRIARTETSKLAVRKPPRTQEDERDNRGLADVFAAARQQMLERR